MAKQLNVNLKVSADTSIAQQALHKLSQSLSAIQNSSSNAFSNLGLENAKMAAKDLQMHLQNAVNVDTGKLDLNKFSSSLVKSNQNLTILSQKLLQGGANGQQAFSALARSIALADTRAINLGTRLNGLLITLKNTVRWQISSSVLHGFMSAVSGAYTYAQKLNESLTDIQIVTESSSEKMAKFAKEANKAAQALNTTTNTYAKAALIYYQQGLDDKQVKERTDLTIKMANVTGNTAKTVSEQLTAIWNNFDDGSRSLESYIDVITALGASTASSTTEIAEGLEKFAAIARTVGLSYEYATSALATVVAKTRQSADVVGTAFKTLFARIQDLELGKTLDDGTTLGRYSEALATIGVNIKNANGELKDMDDILDELGAKWDQIDRGTQVAVAQAVGGTRQYQQLIAILDNWDYMQKNLNVAAGSEGTLSRQAEIYAGSWEAAKNRVKASAEEIYKTLLNDQFFISITNGFSKFLNIISELLDGLGGVKGLLLTISSIIVTRYMAELPRLMGNVANSIGVLFGAGNRQQQKMLNETASLAHAQNLKLNSANTPGYDKTAAQYEADFLERTTRLSAQAEKATKNLSLAKKEEYQNRIRNYQAMGDEIVELQRQGELLNTENKNTIRTLSRQGASYATAHGTTTKSTYQTGKDVKEKLKLYAEKSEQQARIDSFEDSFKNGRENLKTELDNISTNLNSDDKTVRAAAELDSKNVSTKMLGLADYAEERIKEIKPNHKLTEDQQKAINDFRAEIQAANGDVEKLQNTLANFTKNSPLNSIFRESGRQVSQLSDELTDLEEELKETYGISQKQLNNIYEKASEAGISKEEALRKYSVEKNNEPSVKDITEQNQAGLQQISQIASSLMSIYMLINSIQQLGNIWGDENLTTSEKLLQTLSSMVMILPALSMMFQTTAGKAMVAAVSQGIFKKAIKATGDEAAKAGTKMWASLGPYLVIVLAVIAAVTALVLVFKALSNWYNKDKLAAEEAAKSAAALAEQYDKVKSAYDEMMKSISSYEDAEKALDKLTKGTKEYEEALKDANKQARALIQANKLKEGQDYEITSDGQIKIKDEALRRIQDESLSQVNSAEAVSEMANINAQKAQAKADRTALKRKNDGVNAWGRIGAGIGTVLLNGFLPGLGAWLGANAIGNLEQTAKARQESTDAVVDAIRDGNLNLSGDMSRAEFEETLKTAVNNGDLSIDLNDSKLIQALYDSRDTMQELADAENAAKEAQKQAAKQYARDIFGMDENLVASGSINDLAEMGQKIIITSEEAALDSFKQAYKDNGEEITKKYIELYGDTLGDNVKYKGKGKYTYTDESGKTKTKKISEDILKNFYSTTQGETTLKANQQRIVEAYNATATNAAARAALVNQNFESITRQQFEQFKFSSEQELAKALGAYEGENLDEFAKKVLGSESWQDYLITIQKAEADAKKAWASFNGTAVQQLAEVEGISLETAQRFMNIMNDMKNNPLYSQNANIITQGIKDLASGSTEALDALSQLDYSSYDIGRQVKNTLTNLGVQLSMSEDEFEHWVKAVRQTHNTIPTFNDLLTNLNNIYTVLENIDFGKMISREDYETLTAYNIELKKMFQYVGDNKFRFNGNKAELTKSIEAQTAQELNDLKQYIEISKQLKENDRLTSQTLIGEGASTSTVNSRAHAIDAIFSATTDSQGNQVDSVWSILKKYNPEYDEGFFREQRSRDEINELLTLYNNLFTASERSTELMQQQASYAKDIAKLNEQLKNGEIDEETYKQQLDYIKDAAKENLKYAKDIIKEIEYLNRLLSRQQKITETLYGANKLASLEEESKLINQVIASTQDEIATLKEELKIRMALLKAKGANFDSTGKMTNGWQLYREGIISKEDLDAYQELWETLLDAEDILFDKQTEKLQKNYEKLTEALEQKLDLIDRDMTRLDSHFSRIEDDVYKAAEAFNLLNKKQKLNLTTLQTYENHYTELEQKWTNKEITQADYAAGLQEIYDAIYDNIDALYELDKEMREYYTDFLSNMNEEIEKYTKTFEHLTKLTEHYKNIMEFTGDSKDYDKMELLYTASLKNINNKLQVAKAEMDAAQAQYNFLMSQPNKLEEDVEAVTNQLQEKTEAYFETLEEKIEATQNLVKNGLDRAAAQLEKTLTGGTTFERLNQSMSMMSKFSELFYTTTNQVYETQKRINNVTQELAKTTNKNYQNELKMWKMRLESAQKQEKLSKNQLALMDAEFKLIQARAAFEEAQNAKSTVRLTRDAEGNYGYVFTADQENITKAQQAVQDAENDLYNKQLEIANKNAELIVQIQQEMFNKIKEINNDLTLSAEERELRIQEIYQQYSPYILALTNDRNMAISYSEENTAKIMRDAWSMTFEETINKCSSWQEAYQIYTEECGKYLNDWYKVVEEVTKNTGLKFDDLKKKMSNITKESDAIRIALIGKDGNGGIVEALNKVAQEILTKTSEYADFADELGKVASHYEGIANNAYAALAAMQAVADFAATGSADTREEVYWNSDNAGEKINYYDYNGNLVQSTDISDDTKEHYKKMNEYRNKAKQEGISDSERAYYASLYQDERNKYNAGVAAEADADLTINDKYKAISDDPAWNYDKQREGFAYEQGRIDAKVKQAKSSWEAYNKKEENAKTKEIKADNKSSLQTVQAKFKSSGEIWDNGIFSGYWKSTELPAITFNNEDEFNDFIQTDTNGKKYFPVYRTRNPILGTTQPVGYIPLDSLTIKRYGPTGRVQIHYPSKKFGLYQMSSSYDTGGYTGKWGPEGKLATLHEKELVLNKQDTQNILAAVSLIRQIASAIDLQALMQSFGLLSVGATKIGTLAHTNLEQKVEITAQFPNAIYHDEIKEAFDTLINRASQYANRNY